MDDVIKVQGSGEPTGAGTTATWYVRFQLPLTLFLCALLSFLRKPGAFLTPQFWAEDGTVFFKQAIEQGVASIWVPYNGYYHLYPRVLSEVIISLFPYRNAPLLFNLAALGAQLFVVAHLFVPRVSIRYRTILAMMLVLSPVGSDNGTAGSEVFLVLTNAQWYLALSLLLLTITTPARTRAEWAFDCATLSIVSLTGPFIVPMSTIFVLRYVFTRNVYTGIMAFLAVAFAVVQSLHVAEGLPPSTIAWGPLADFAAACSSFVSYSLLGPAGRTAIDATFVHVVVASLGLLAYGSFALWCLFTKRYPRLTLLAGGVVIFAVTMIKFRHEPIGLFAVAAPRYFFIPTIALMWCIVLTIEEFPRLVSISLLCIIINFASSKAFIAEPMVDLHWRKQARCLERKKECTISVNPPTWQAVIKPK